MLVVFLSNAIKLCNFSCCFMLLFLIPIEREAEYDDVTLIMSTDDMDDSFSGNYTYLVFVLIHLIFDIQVIQS